MSRSGPPNGRLMLVLIAVALVLGIALGYWMFNALT